MHSCHLHVKILQTNSLLCPVSTFDDLEGADEILVDEKHARGIVEFSAILRRRKNSYTAPIGTKFIPIFHDLMSSGDKIQVLLFKELVNNIGAKDVGDYRSPSSL